MRITRDTVAEQLVAYQSPPGPMMPSTNFVLALFLVTAILRLYTGADAGEKRLCVIGKHV